MSLKTIHNKRLTNQLKEVSYFTLAGIANTFADFFVFNFLLLLFPTQHSLLITGYSMIGFLIANLQSFWINKNWTFKKNGMSKGWEQYTSFFLISIVSLGINSLTFYLLQFLIPAHSTPILNMEKLVASSLGIISNFLGYQKIVFRVSGELSTIANDAVCLKSCQKGFSPEITLVIPAFNESIRMDQTLKTLITFSAMHRELEILIVDDGSSDGTSENIESIYHHMPHLTHYRLKENWGKGGAVRFGLSAAKGKFVFFCDADLSFPLEQLECLRNELDHADVVVGIRRRDGQQPIKRRIQSSFFRLLVHKLNLTPVQDTQCGFKGFHAPALAKLLPETKCCDFTFDIELLALAKKNSLSIREANIQWLHQEGSTIRFTHILQMLYSLMLIRIRLDRLFSTEFWLGCTLFLFALLVRIPYLYNVPHFIDEWGEVRLAAQISRGEIWPLHNTAHDIGAFYNYLLALTFALFGHQLFLPRLFVTLFSAGTVVLTFLVARQWTGLKTAFIAGLLLATNGMHILVTHMAWSNDLTPFFVTLAILNTIYALKRTNRYMWGYCGFVWALALQTHSSVLAPLIGAFLFLGKEIKIRNWRNEHRIQFFVGAFLIGYSNMIVHNIIKPLDSIFWIRHKDYALNPHLTPSIYWSNMKNMGIELARTLASAYPNGTGILHTLSVLMLYLLLGGLLFTLPILLRKKYGELLLSIIVASFIIIPVFNNRYVFFISTRYIAYLIPICYVIVTIGLDSCLKHFQSLSIRKMRTLITVLGGLIILAPLYHFYSYAAQYTDAGEDNSAEYTVVHHLVQVNSSQEPIYVDLGGKQGKAIAEMLRVKGLKTHLVGEQPEVQMVTVNQGEKEAIDYSKWLNALQTKAPKGWFTLSPDHVGPLTQHFQITWDKTFYITRSNGETAYFIGRIASVGLK
ncbi:MAG TPA: glycosyltransferase [Bacillota bacterium]|nr:glycosyltransferase [Bacillota bacterium]